MLEPMIRFSAVAGVALGLLVQHPLSGLECTARDCFVTGSVLKVFPYPFRVKSSELFLFA